MTQASHPAQATSPSTFRKWLPMVFVAVTLILVVALTHALDKAQEEADRALAVGAELAK